jgi:hypothetical protein
VRGETVTLVRLPAGFDPYGAPVEGPVEHIPVAGCAVAPRNTALEGETVDYGREGLITGTQVFMPLHVEVRHTDQIVARGVRYDVEGRPGRWESPYSRRRPGQVIILRRAEG